MEKVEKKKEVTMDIIDEDRVTWDNPVQFFLTVLGFCVGLGNIWRFPYLCQQNGGGAFILPFLVMLIVVGMPLLLLELGLGQRMRVGAAGAWKQVHPALSGVGYGSAVVASIVGCYYNVIIAWSFYYLGSSLTSTLPWSTCPLHLDNQTIAECEESSETQFFWYRTTLDASGSIDDWGGIKYWVFLCLVLSWVVVYLILMKGIASSGKVVYFTAIFPYIVLTIFFIRGITLKGASAGLSHMFRPKLEMLLKPTVWLDAANQVFYSFGLAFGSIISFGSYNPPNKNCVKDVIIITIANAFTAIYACAVIFSILGFKAMHLFDKCMEHDIGILVNIHPEFQNRNIEDIPFSEYRNAMDGVFKNHGHTSLKNCSLVKELDESAQGTGFAFIVMAEVFTKIPGAPLWSALFFMMLLSLGLGSQIGILEGVMSTLFDQPSLRHVKKPVLVGCVSVVCFCVGVIFTTGSGEYWLTLFDTFGATGLTFIAFTELVSVMYVYGHERFTQDIKNMTGLRPTLYWQIMWRYISPIFMATVIISSVYFMLSNTPTYTAWNQQKAIGEKKEYPEWALGLAALLSMSSLIPIIMGLLIHLINTCIFTTKNNSPVNGRFFRVDTSASTRPMMEDNLEEYPISYFNGESDSEDDETDIENGTVEKKSNAKSEPFNMEVVH